MFINTIDEKPFFLKEDGTMIKDLTQSIFNFRTSGVVNFTLYKVPKDFEMRVDLISAATYNNTLYAEFILKYNSISNPFSIAADDIILIPNLGQATDQITKGTLVEGNNSKIIRDSYKYIDPTKVPKKDSTVAEFDNREFKSGALPPNIAPEGETNIVYRNGRVFFGEGIGKSACLTNGMSSSEFLTKVIKQKI